ncbi:YceD family protein [Accumulibacter sp.]|jgi:uncharacterized protein|uniref:YceD family protein n=1 Tax=Accumulibacter sp. TaxID=2053492 RepID=UPI001AC7A018|nr:YceD family protein [Accumulibacter sp.]MBN8453905.1 DUF177 domain-containing protein [Accumulibacter sp.]
MSRPVVIDSQEFGRGEGSLQGDVLVATLTRLHDLLTDTGGSLSFRIDGRRGARERSQLLLTVDGMLSLCCQRCLEAYEYPLHLRSLLEFVGNDEDLTQDELEDDAKDYLPHQQALDVVVLIEDEILLALPAAPRHENCALPGSRVESARVSPFSVLAGLQGKVD